MDTDFLREDEKDLEMNGGDVCTATLIATVLYT